MKVVVIGAGPGGYVAAIKAAQLGAEVVIIEKEHMGGTCLNVGCIPTKVLLHTAEIFSILKEDSSQLGIKADNIGLEWDTLQKRKGLIVHQLVSGVDTLMKKNKIQKIMGKAKFLSKNEIEVVSSDKTVQRINFDKAIIATGSEPVIVPIKGVDNEGVITSTEALSLENIPKDMCIIGGGVIGSEFADLYASFGTKVTIIEALPEIVGAMDEEIVSVLKKKFVHSGIEVYTNTRVESIQKQNDKLVINTSSAGGNKSFEAEKVLMATGRRPTTKGLGLEDIGVKLNRRAIVVDRRTMVTNIENIYAIGDCNGGVLLAHVASAEGIVAAESIMGKVSKVDFKTIPYAMYTKPELAGVGITETEAKKRGYNVKVGRFPLYANGKSLILGEHKGLVKFVVDASTDEILGLHMAGPRATELIVEGALALRLEATIDEIITTIHAHPTVGESLHEAAHAVLGEAIHL